MGTGGTPPPWPPGNLSLKALFARRDHPPRLSAEGEYARRVIPPACLSAASFQTYEVVTWASASRGCPGARAEHLENCTGFEASGHALDRLVPDGCTGYPSYPSGRAPVGWEISSWGGFRA